MVKQESQQSRKLQDSVRVRVGAPDRCLKHSGKCFRDEGHHYDCFTIMPVITTADPLKVIRKDGYYIDDNDARTHIEEKKYWPADAKRRVHRWNVQK